MAKNKKLKFEKSCVFFVKPWTLRITVVYCDILILVVVSSISQSGYVYLSRKLVYTVAVFHFLGAILFPSCHSIFPRLRNDLVVSTSAIYLFLTLILFRLWEGIHYLIFLINKKFVICLPCYIENCSLCYYNVIVVLLILFGVQLCFHCFPVDDFSGKRWWK